MEPVARVLNKLESSQALQAVLEMTLLVGNFLNHGTFKGNARAFALSSLNKVYL